MTARTVLTRTALAALLLALAACGRAGPLEPPPARTAPDGTPEQTQPEGADRPFILDGLIQ
jgi:predicted small lipoprotein YifL